MHAVRIWFLGLLAASAVGAAPAPPSAPAAPPQPELCGLEGAGGTLRFNLKIPGYVSSQWLAVGDTFGGWRIAQYRAADQLLVLRRSDGTELSLAMKPAEILPAPGSAPATAVAPVATTPAPAPKPAATPGSPAPGAISAPSAAAPTVSPRPPVQPYPTPRK